ncbi:MAG TPA: hypothetical protein VIK39_00370 [Candidatus Angelobacter sp.]
MEELAADSADHKNPDGIFDMDRLNQKWFLASECSSFIVTLTSSVSPEERAATEMFFWRKSVYTGAPREICREASGAFSMDVMIT